MCLNNGYEQQGMKLPKYKTSFILEKSSILPSYFVFNESAQEWANLSFEKCDRQKENSFQGLK